MRPPPTPPKAAPRQHVQEQHEYTPLVQQDTHEHDTCHRPALQEYNAWQSAGWIDYENETVDEPQPSRWLGQDQSDDLSITIWTHECIVCQGTGSAQTTTFEFATWKQEPHVWQDMLTTRGCDEPAIAEFFALCQSGEAGYNDGMKLIHKMLKKETGGWEKNNPPIWSQWESRFITDLSSMLCIDMSKTCI